MGSHLHEKLSMHVSLGRGLLGRQMHLCQPIEAEIASISYALNYVKLTQQRDLVMQKSGHFLCVGTKIDRKTIKQMHYIKLGVLMP